MEEREIFINIDSNTLVEMISVAEESIILASPGIQTNVAKALANSARTIKPEMITVCLDVNEAVFRMGYGDIRSIDILRDNNILVHHVSQLRFALIIIDGCGYSFTPTALLLESGVPSSDGFNALRLSKEQSAAAASKLSPAAKAIALMKASSDAERDKIKNTPTVVQDNPTQDSQVNYIKDKLEKAPPIPFDTSRQVRVYSSYLQYVDISMTGASIQRKKISIPKSLLGNSKSNDTIKDRIKTTFNLLPEGDEISSKNLDEKLKEIRDNFTRTLGKKEGRVILKQSKPLFEKKIELLKQDIEYYCQRIQEKLEARISASLKDVIEYYLPIVRENIPDKILGSIPTEKINDEKLRVWIAQELQRCTPSVESLLKEIELDITYKDVTYETLKDDDFIGKIKREFPLIDWDEAHEEYIAAKGSEDNIFESNMF
ncbi:hypothetical protein L3V31_14465 [Vibrio sp. J1-1]|uniref:hypothetical protein n=1 Tax=Vibrio sp. J1-1 TaxID=2912251 RepID=UPI001F34FE87|nr:hypothetical protein [Vibrio sp. J1-1]MCF7482915.1 hypothetical protein [Vibrio sp. J1-1]